MAQCIVHVGDDRFFVWPTYWDAPVSPILPLDQFEPMYHRLYNGAGAHPLEERIERARLTGTSWKGREMTAEECIAGSRAGMTEHELPYKKLVLFYSGWNERSAKLLSRRIGQESALRLHDHFAERAQSQPAKVGATIPIPRPQVEFVIETNEGEAA